MRLLRLALVQGGEAAHDQEKSGHEPGRAEDQQIVLPPVFHYFLNLAQQGLEGRVLDGLRFEGLLELESEFHEARLVGTRDILLLLHESLVLHLLAQPGQPLLQLLVLQLALARPPQLPFQHLVRNPSVSAVCRVSLRLDLLAAQIRLSRRADLAAADLFPPFLLFPGNLRSAFLYHPSPSLLFIDNINNLNCWAEGSSFSHWL